MQPHPAPFSAPILDRIRELMQDEVGARVLDPYAGTCRVLEALPHTTKATLIDIEECFIAPAQEKYGPARRNTSFFIGDSREVLRTLRARRATFTHIITSPDYGNRFSDKYNPTPGRVCASYAQSKGGALEPGNGAAHKFGSDDYTDIHIGVLTAAVARLVPRGKLILNVSDFYRTMKKGEEPSRMPVVPFWTTLCFDLGLHLLSAEPIYTRRLKRGENRHRVPYESLLVFEK